MRKKGWLKSAAAVATSVVMMATAGMTPVMAEVNTFAGVAQDGRYYTDYTTLEDAQAAAAQLAIQIASEGDVLLKMRIMRCRSGAMSASASLASRRMHWQAARLRTYCWRMR